MRIVQFGVVCLLTAGLLNCSKHPLPEDTTGLNTVGVVQKVLCETKDAIEAHDQPNKFAGSAAVFEFNFIITENNNASGDASFVIPISHGTFSIGLNTGIAAQRKGDRQVKIAKPLGDIRKMPCSDGQLVQHFPQPYPITGHIGMEEYVRTFVDLKPNEQTVAVYRDTLSFTTTIKGGANPSITLLPSPGHTFKANAALAADRVDLHQVTVSFSRAPTVAEIITAQISGITQVEKVPEGTRAFLARIRSGICGPGKERDDKCKACLKDLAACRESEQAEIERKAETKGLRAITPAPIVGIDPVERALRDFDRESNIRVNEQIRDLLRERP